jgi:hypothetical protein
MDKDMIRATFFAAVLLLVPSCSLPESAGRVPDAPVETVLALAAPRAAVARDQAAEVKAVPGEIRERFKLKGDFYAKYVDAEGIPILSSATVNDAALLEARYVVLNMLRGREDLLETMRTRRIRLSVMAWNEFNTDMPESKNLPSWWDRRSRGISGVKATTCGEENLLNYRGDPFVGGSILVHEFTHAFQHSGMSILDRTFNARVRAAYNKAKASGQFRGYAMTRQGEFFAEGAQSWFHANRKKDFMRVQDGKKTPLNTREQIIQHVPDLAELLRETFGDNPWRYTPTHQRSDQEHLKDFDRTKAPRFAWPKDVLAAWNKELARRRAKSKRATQKPK